MVTEPKKLSRFLYKQVTFTNETRSSFYAAIVIKMLRGMDTLRADLMFVSNDKEVSI
jgi:hypothetical protein